MREPVSRPPPSEGHEPESSAHVQMSSPPTSADEIRTPAAGKPTAMDHVIPMKNIPALLGYYFGVFSLLPVLGIPLGIAAITCGVFGLRAAGPTGVGGGHAITALVLGTIFGGGQCLIAVLIMLN